MSHIQDAKRRWGEGGKKREEERPGDKSHGQKENTARPGGPSLKNEEDEGSSPRTDEVTRAKREALHRRESNVVVSLGSIRTARGCVPVCHWS